MLEKLKGTDISKIKCGIIFSPHWAEQIINPICCFFCKKVFSAYIENTINPGEKGVKVPYLY
jgi:hypothetical protein